jgi:hypothetical protein
MSLLDEADPEILISRLAAPLETPAQPAFRAAAYEAMARLTTVGPGSMFEAIAPLQANYFTPPSDCRAGYDALGKTGARIRSNKLTAEPPIEHARYGPGGRPLKGTV